MAGQSHKTSVDRGARTSSLSRLDSVFGGLLLLLAVFLHARAANAAAAPRPLPATETFAQWLARPHNLADPQTSATGLTLARARAQELRPLMEDAPELFLRTALPEAQRNALPAEWQPFIEKRIKGRGSFGVYCRFPKPVNAFNLQPSIINAHGGYAREVTLNGTLYKAFVFGKWKDQTTVQEAAIEGIALQDAIVLGDTPTPAQQLAAGGASAASAPLTTGANTLLYMIARFSDETSDPIDDATALSRVGVISAFWLNNSSGKVSLKGLVNPGLVMDIVHITLPHPTNYTPTYDSSFSLLLGDARNAALALSPSYNYANYNLDVVVTSDPGFSYAGYSWIGAQGSHWIQGYTTLRTGGHELGHNLGLQHANYWRTDATLPFGEDSNPGGYVGDAPDSEWVEYGHYFSVMSGQSGGELDDPNKPHYTPTEKVQLGWLSGNQVSYLTTSGTNRLFRHDERTTIGIPRAIRIETPATDYTGLGRRYWLGYRYAPWNTAQNWFRNGLQVDVAETGYGPDGTIMLDMTPYSQDDPSGASWTDDNTDKLDGALIVGRTYDDQAAGIHITPIATGNNGTNEEYIDVVVNLGTFSGNTPPVISSFSASTNQAAVNQTVTFNVTASDANGDTLAYAWNFDDGQVWTPSGLNSPSAGKSWPNAGQYRVMVTVSDMKGGVATETIIVTVGAPANTNQIWGRVVWAGTPLSGALVSTASGGTIYQAWTESDGSYVLIDLPSSGSLALRCLSDGHTFTPQFSNPLSITSGNLYGKDFYANEPLSAPAGATFAISGQITYAGVGITGVEVRAGGLLANTDQFGNYTLTNFPTGTYTITAANGNWTFSPASRTVTISSADSTGNDFSRSAPYSITGRIDGVPASGNSQAPTVYLGNGDLALATKAGTGGSRYWTYTLIGVPPGQFSPSAELAGYRIVPNGFSNPLSVSGNLTGINYSGSASNVDGIDGRITERGLPLAGVSVAASLGGSTIGSAQTDSDGFYQIVNLASGAYTLTPGKSGYSFSPSSMAVAAIPESGDDFTAIGPNAPPAISSVTTLPAVAPSVAATAALTARASGSNPLSYSWDALIAAGPVTFSTNDSVNANVTVASFQSPGSYLFRVRVTDDHSLYSTDNVGVTVSAGPGDVVVSPYQVQVASGGTATFHADVWDQLGNRITVAPAWSVSGGGVISTGGVFTATTPGGPYTVSATASGLSATGFVSVVGGTNHPPVAASPTLQRYASQGVKALITTLLGTDADGDPLSLSTFDALSTNGVPVSTNQGWIFYSPTNSFTNADAFNYTVSDGRGGTSAGVVTVQVKADPAPSMDVSVERMLDGSVHLRFDGIPGRTYAIQYTEDLGNPQWQTLASVTADSFGIFTYVDLPPNGSATRYYRAALF